MAKTFKPKICITCGKEYIPNNSCQKHCSEACRRKAYADYNKMRNKNREFKCAWCGKTFISDYRREYCTSECRKAANNRDKKKRRSNKKNNSLMQVVKLAREAGLTYGQYVAKMGL